jgi:hypothetical protein
LPRSSATPTKAAMRFRISRVTCTKCY